MRVASVGIAGGLLIFSYIPDTNHALDVPCISVIVATPIATDWHGLLHREGKVLVHQALNGSTSLAHIGLRLHCNGALIYRGTGFTG
jgi:hypothetical protein